MLFESWYAYSRGEEICHPELREGRKHTDICVIGGGVTGCSAALHLRKFGYNVALVESNSIGYGASGRSGGQILPGFAVSISDLIRDLGVECAGRLWKISERAVDLVEDLIHEYAIECDFQSGCFYAANKKRHASALRKELEALGRLSSVDAARWLSEKEASEEIGTNSYLGGVAFSRAFHLNPLDFTKGLARAASDYGVQIYERSPVERIVYGDKVITQTSGGQIASDVCVIATNALDLPGVSGFKSDVIPVRNDMTATEPLSRDQLRFVIPCRWAVSDSKFLLDYYRLSRDNRLIFGGAGALFSFNQKAIQKTMKKRIGKLFPALRDIEIDFIWSGMVGVTPNRLPEIGRLSDNVFFARGFSGHGMALGTFVGKSIATRIAGEDADFLELESIPQRRLVGGPGVKKSVFAAERVVRRMRDLF